MEKNTGTMSVSAQVNNLNSESKAAAERVTELQETVGTLKSELQGVVAKVEQNVEIFKEGITTKIALILNLLSKKQSHIQNTLDNCYKIIDNLVETFLNIGYELEKDIARISLKVNDFDSEIKNMANTSVNGKNSDDSTLWFVNCDGRLTKRKNIVLSSILPRYKCGDRKMRRSFVRYLEEVFQSFQVPNNLWVSLASSQLIGMAHDWWNMHDKSMPWSQFTKCFIDWTFSDNNIRRKMKLPIKRQNNELKRPVKNVQSPFSSVNTSTSELMFGKPKKRKSSDTCDVVSFDSEINQKIYEALSKQAINQNRMKIGGNSSNYSLAVQESFKMAERTSMISEENKSEVDSETESFTSSFNLCKKKKCSYAERGTKNKKEKLMNQQFESIHIKSATPRKKYSIRKRKT